MQEEVFIGDLVTFSSGGKVFRVIDQGFYNPMSISLCDTETGENGQYSKAECKKLSFTEIMMYRIWQKMPRLQKEQ